MAFKKNTSTPRVSVIVLTLNSAQTIRRCLDSIRRLDYPSDGLEIVVVDNGSMDETLTIVAEYGIKSHVVPEANIAQLRNFGARKAHGEVIGFVDSDCEISPGWIRAALAHLSESTIGVAGCYYALPESANWIENAWHMRRRPKSGKAKFVPAGNMVMRREIFDRVNGFDVRWATGEDTDFCARVRQHGFEIVSDPQLHCVHWGNPKTVGAFVRKQIWHGKGMSRFLWTGDVVSRVFLMTNVFLLAHVGTFMVLLLPLSFHIKYHVVLAAGPLVLFMCCLAAVRRCVQFRNFKYIFHLVLLWYLYFLGRSVSMLRIYRDAVLGRERISHTKH